MTSSSKSTKQRSNVTQTKQGTSSLESNPLDLTRLLSNNEQRKVFEEHFHGRTIFTPKFGSTTGFSLVCEWDNYNRNELYYSLCRISKEEIELRKQHGFGETIKNKDILSAGHLKLEDRLLHYFLSYVILPKFSNHSQIIDIELQLMYAMKYNIKINWAPMIIRQMWTVRGTQSPLPYAILITNILEHSGVSTVGETKVSLNFRESKIDVEFVHKMSFSIDPHDCRTYKHRIDKPTAPANQPETANPNPYEFHAQSSSSAAMPSNQMIMDELFSLQGYIFNQVDALDAQNQQIQYELHRLSYKLSSMDIDETPLSLNLRLSLCVGFLFVMLHDCEQFAVFLFLLNVFDEDTNITKKKKGRILIRTKKIKLQEKISLSLNRSDPLAQARDSRSSENLTASTGSKNAISRPGETTLAQARLLSLKRDDSRSGENPSV
ncbi:hypothetical protein Lal_00035477 [Lupinus albus]|nr:hypothetical protein Lal_00035477 [Lupinus albus]